MLAVPWALGVAPFAPTGPQLLLAVAAVLAYLLSAALQGWLRPRTRDAHTLPLVVYAIAFALAGGILAVSYPYLLAALAVIVPAAALTLRSVRSGVRRELAASLAQVAIALILVPAAAALGPTRGTDDVVRSTVAAGIYLCGTVLVVRSVIRERLNATFTAVSVAYHGAACVVAAVVLPVAYAAFAVGLTIRAAALPALQRRWLGRRQLRPIHVGAVEIMASGTLVALAVAIPR